MPTSLLALLITLGSIPRSRLDLQLEILALRHQIGVLERSFISAPPTHVHRSSSVGLALPLLASLAIDVAHRQSGNGCGLASQGLRPILEERPAISRQNRDLIRRMCRENPTLGAPRIHVELLKLGIDIGESSVSKYMLRGRKPPSQTWRTFLENHLSQIVSVDFFTVPHHLLPGPVRVPGAGS
jgi:putative transposase